MSNNKKDLTKALSNQLMLLDSPEPEAGSLDIHHEFCAALSRAISRSGKSRYQVASEMSEMIGRDITKSMIDAYTAESHHEHNFPAEYLPAFCIVCQNFDPLKLIGRHSRCEVLESQEAIYAVIARYEKQKQDLEKQINKLKACR